MSVPVCTVRAIAFPSRTVVRSSIQKLKILASDLFHSQPTERERERESYLEFKRFITVKQ